MTFCDWTDQMLRMTLKELPRLTAGLTDRAHPAHSVIQAGPGGSGVQVREGPAAQGPGRLDNDILRMDNHNCMLSNQVGTGMIMRSTTAS